MKKIFCFSSLLVCSFIASSAHAFWDQSHQLIGSIASKNVSEKTNKAVERLLNIPLDYPGSFELSKNTNGFDTAASWADDIKSYKDQDINNDLSSCHYIDIPFTKEKIGKKITDAEVMEKLNMIMEKNSQNSISCLKSSIKTLLVTSTSDANKAIAVRMIIHIVGDIGQPLHNASLVSKNEADEGGNKIIIDKPVTFQNINVTSSVANNLHKIWDGSLGIYLQFPYNNEKSKLGYYTDEEKEATDKNAKNIFESSDFVNLKNRLLNDKNEESIEFWSINSYKIAVKYAYSDLVFKSLNKFDKATFSVQFKEGWKNYQSSRADIIDMQIKKSGIRLSYLLNSIFDNLNIKNPYFELVSNIKNDDNIKPLFVR
ncbi:S1/P1 nuclease [Silvanigrella aquatica]|uniref:S1/P1 Nuclease n=1 Tax=Silvanigrella aquatica TaxID=1915309 RepID=A0A1L4CYS5_9BACT|nr:S1/P1 nuclease [Silvanigrella aquatica]APJ03085.1 hypothetical protein AXG55_03840 [Silvanigrella aquatica]